MGDMPLPKNTTNPGHFGPGIIGEEEFEREKAYKETGQDTFGPLVTGKWPKDHPQAPKPEPGSAFELETATKLAQVAISLTKLDEILSDNPFVLDGLIDAEFARAEGPRKGALRKFVEVEEAKTSPEPRPEVLDRLATTLRDLG